MAKHGVTTFLDAFESDCATFFDLVPDLLVCTDRRGNVTRVNRSFELALGYARAEMYGKGLMHIVLANDLVKFIGIFSHPELRDVETFRLLHKSSGIVTCRLMNWKIKHERSFIVMRRAHE